MSNLRNLKIEIDTDTDESVLEALYDMIRIRRWTVEIINVSSSLGARGLWFVHSGLSPEGVSTLIQAHNNIEGLKFKAFEKAYVKKELSDYENNGWRDGEPPKDGRTYEVMVGAPHNRLMRVRAHRHAEGFQWAWICEQEHLNAPIHPLRWRNCV